MPRPTQGPKCVLPVRGCHPLWPDFPVRSGSRNLATGLVRVRSPLLTESRLMSFPPATEMFQFAGFASPPYEFRRRYPQMRVGCPIRRSADQRLLASPRGLSQRATSFIASQCQGIHQMPLKCLISRPHSAPSQAQTGQPVKPVIQSGQHSAHMKTRVPLRPAQHDAHRTQKRHFIILFTMSKNSGIRHRGSGIR